MKSLMLCALAAGALCSPASAEFRKWTDAASKRSMEAEFVSQTDAKVTVRLKDGKAIALEKVRLSKDDQEYLKTAKTDPATAPAAPVSGAAARPIGFNEAKIDKRSWNRPAPPKDLKVTTVDFPVQVETPHFFLAGTPKVRAEVIDIYAESAERLWTQLALFVPALTEMFKDKRMALWLIEDRDANVKFGNWVGKNMGNGSTYTWDRSTICYVNFSEDYAAAQKFLPAARTFRMDMKGNMRNLKWPERIHFIAGDIFRIYLDPVKKNDDYSLNLIELGFAYYLELEVCGNITTEVTYGGGASVEGFRNGRAWPATIKNLLKNPVVKPGIGKILKAEVSKAEPMDIGAAFALMHWSFRDPARSKSFNDLLATAITDTEAPDPAAFAKAFGFETAEAFDAALVAYMKSDQFK